MTRLARLLNRVDDALMFALIGEDTVARVAAEHRASVAATRADPRHLATA